MTTPTRRAKTVSSIERRAAEAHAAREAARAAAAQAASQGVNAPLFPEYFDKPIEFALVVLGLRLCRAQRRILLALTRHKRIAIRSGQKTGKSTSFIAAALWWAATRPRGRVLLTAPTGRQVKKVLWAELRRIVYDRSNTREDGRTVADVLGVEPALSPETGMQWPDGREIVGFSAKNPGSTQGFSGPEMLIVIDEGAEVADDIFEAHEGNTAAGGTILAASNPIHSIGWFYEAFHTQAEFWEGIHLSSTDTPNVTGDEPPIPGLAEKAFIDMQRKKYGPNSKYFLERILGEFSGKGSNAIVILSKLEKSIARYRAEVTKRWAEHYGLVDDDEIDFLDLEQVQALFGVEDGPLEIGLDVARFGDDDSTVAPRRGLVALPGVEVNGFDGNDVAGLVMTTVRKCRRGDEKVIVRIDGTGGYGASPADILRANHSNEVIVIEVNSSEAADDDELYANQRAQMHFGVAQFIEDGGMLPPDAKLKVELLAATYKYDNRQRFIVEPKRDIKKRIGRSPDRSDARALSILTGGSAGPPGVVTGTGTRWGDDVRGY